MTTERYSHAVLVTGARTWHDEVAMRQTFNQLWLRWGLERVTRPVLISGSASRGADAMAERLWTARGYPVISMPADRDRDGRGAGLARNTSMVQLAARFRDDGAIVCTTAFLDRCLKPSCPQQNRQQLLPGQPGHFSHGAIHCRQQALLHGLHVVDNLLSP